MSYGVWFRDGKQVRSGPQNCRVEIQELGNRVVVALDAENYTTSLFRLGIRQGDPVEHVQGVLRWRLRHASSPNQGGES